MNKSAGKVSNIYYTSLYLQYCKIFENWSVKKQFVFINMFELVFDFLKKYEQKYGEMDDKNITRLFKTFPDYSC